MSEHAGKSETELVTETFVDRLHDLHPNADREELYNVVINTVNEMVEAAEEEEGEDEEG